MKFLWPLLLVFSFKAQTNLFRMYPQMQPSSAYWGAGIMTPVKTSDGGFIFSCNPTDANLHGPLSVDYISVKTNFNYIPQWRRRNFSKIIALPTGGIISIYLNGSNQAFIDKQTSSGQVIWSKEIKGPNSLTYTVSNTSISDAVIYNNKIRVIGTTYLKDFNGISQNIEPYTSELDTASGNVISALSLLSTTSSTLSSQLFYFNNIYRDAQGSFYLIGTSKAGITKFSSNFTFMWQLSWVNAVYNPQVAGIKFTSGGDLFCAMNYYDTILNHYKPGIMRVNNPATIVLEKQLQNMLGFSGIENMPSNNFLFSYLKKQSVLDTLKTQLLAVDVSANVLWQRSYHQSMAVSPPLALGNGEYLLCFMSAKTSSNAAQNPIAFTIDQFGNSACTSQSLNVTLTTYSSSPVLGTVVATPITLTVTNSPTVNVSLQSFKDTCGGNQLGFLGLLQLENQVEFAFWPNPATNKIHINSSYLNQGGEIYLVSLTGEVLKRLDINDERIDLSGFEPGIYCLQLHLKNQAILSKKLLISREN